MQAYDSIKNGILNGELEPGQLYSETKLSAKIGISRTPMREALQCLSQDGYITIIPSKGFMIRQLNEKDMKDSIQIRCAIEGFCTTVIASQTDTKEGKELLRSLKMILDNMEEALNSDSLEDFIYYDHQFHLLIVNYLHNDEFNQIFQRLLYLIHLTSQDALSAEGRIQGTIDEHLAYYNAVKEGKVDLAFVSANLQVAKPLRMKILRKYRDILIAGMRFEKLKAGKEELSLKELVSYPWISLTAETITRRFLNEYFEKNGLTFAPDMELATTDMILPAVRHNLGLGFIPAEFADAELKSGQVFEIKVKEKLPERNIVLIYDMEYPQSIAAKEFQKFLKEKGN